MSQPEEFLRRSLETQGLYGIYAAGVNLVNSTIEAVTTKITNLEATFAWEGLAQAEMSLENLQMKLPGLNQQWME